MKMRGKRSKIVNLAGTFLTLALMILACGATSRVYASDTLTADWNDPTYVKMMRGSGDGGDVTVSEESGSEDEENVNLSASGTGVASTKALTDRFMGDSYTHDASKLSGRTVRYGVDVSKWQGTIDWTKAKAAGVEFAILRIGYSTLANCTMTADQKFEEYITGIQKVGIPYGIYYFSQARTVAQAKAEAQYTLKLLNGRSLSLPIVIDYETESGYYNYGLTKAQGTAVCKAFCDVIRAAGYTAMVYANKSCLSGSSTTCTVDTAALEADGDLIWLARYNTIAYETTFTGYIPDYLIWQYSSKGSLSGFSSDAVDLDVWYDDGRSFNTGSSTSTSGGTSTSESTGSGTGTDTDQTEESSSTETQATVTAPAKPVGLAAKAVTGTTVQLAWTAVSDADGYEIVRADGYGRTYSLINTVEAAGFTDSGLVAGREYWYRVRAYKNDADGNKVYSSYSTAAAGTTTLSGACRIKVSASSLTIRAQAGSAYSSKGTLKKGAMGVLVSCCYGTDGDLWYKVSATVSGKTVVGYISGKYSAPYVPQITGVKQTAKTGTSITVAWTKQTYVKGYQVYHSNAYNGGYTRQGSYFAGTGSCVDSGLTSHQQYFYRVRAFVTVNGKNIFGAWSSITLLSTTGTNLKMKTSSGANMYKWTGSGYKKVCALPKGTKVTAYYRMKDYSGNWWFYCTGTYKGKTVKGYLRRTLIVYA